MNAMTEVETSDVACVEELTASTLKSALMQITLDDLKVAQGAWQELGENDQDAVLQRLDSRVSGAMRQAIELFATSGIARVKATMEQITVKDGIKVVLSLSRFDAERHAVVDAQGQTAYIVLANPEQFTDAPHAQKPDADQTELDIHDAERSLREIANIAHHGGLIGYNTSAKAMDAIRDLSMRWWDRKECEHLQQQQRTKAPPND